MVPPMLPLVYCGLLISGAFGGGRGPVAENVGVDIERLNASAMEDHLRSWPTS